MIILIFLIICFSSNAFSFAEEYLYILNDKCIVNLYSAAMQYFSGSGIELIKDTHGLIIRINTYDNLSIDEKVFDKIVKIKYFLAKIKNPVIIEVHAGRDFQKNLEKYRNWEVTTLIANELETIILTYGEPLNNKRIKSVGYGEFFPQRNTSNNGGKDSSRIDIIVLCNVIGE